MKTGVSVLLLLLLLSLFLASSFFEVAMGAYATSPAPSPTSTGFCDRKCTLRCSRSGKNKMCMKLCGICCSKCKCVPSGPLASKDECPCYRDWYYKGRPKCP